jgi:hypothetical protein
MAALSSVVSLVWSILARRRINWVEASVTRAWSHDLPPRLFDLSGK